MRYQYPNCGLGGLGGLGQDDVMYAMASGANASGAPSPLAEKKAPPAQTGGFWVPLLMLGAGAWAVSEFLGRKK